MRRTTWICTESFKNGGNFGCPQGIEKKRTFLPRDHSQNFRYETLKSSLLKELSKSHIPDFMWKSRMIKGTFLSFSLITEWMNVKEYMIELLCFWHSPPQGLSTSDRVSEQRAWREAKSIYLVGHSRKRQPWYSNKGASASSVLLKGFRQPLFFFELMHFRNFFCYKIENIWNFKYKIFSRVSPFGTNLICLSPLGLLRFQCLLSFISILKFSYSKPFYSTLNYASTANIQEVMKFYSLGN